MELINHTKFLDFKSAKSPSGHDWFYVHRTNDTNEHDSAVVITTLIKNNDSYDFLFLKTSRPPLTAQNKAKYCLESPAGLIGDINSSEGLIECANKELLEEAGYCASKIFVEATNYSTSSGLSSETLSFVTAIVDEDNLAQKPINDGGIIVDRLKVNSNDIFEYLTSINNKETSVAIATICGVYFAINRLKTL